MTKALEKKNFINSTVKMYLSMLIHRPEVAPNTDLFIPICTIVLFLISFPISFPGPKRIELKIDMLSGVK